MCASVCPTAAKLGFYSRFAILMEVTTPFTEEVRDLAARAVRRGSTIAFQSTLAAAAQAVQRALKHEETLAHAALSLAQNDTLGEMTGELRSIADALQASLDAQGRCLMPPRPEGKEKKHAFRFLRRERPAPPAERPTWWFSLTEAIESLEEGSNRMHALASGQPTDAPSRVLSESTAELLREHHDRLVDEAERWMG